MTDWIEVTVRIPQSIIEESARQAASGLFQKPQYKNDKGGDGYDLILSEVRKQVIRCASDGLLSDIVQKVIEKQLDEVVYSVAVEELKRAVKKVSKEKMTDDLFAQEKDKK